MRGPRRDGVEAAHGQLHWLEGLKAAVACSLENPNCPPACPLRRSSAPGSRRAPAPTSAAASTRSHRRRRCCRRAASPCRVASRRAASPERRRTDVAAVEEGARELRDERRRRRHRLRRRQPRDERRPRVGRHRRARRRPPPARALVDEVAAVLRARRQHDELPLRRAVRVAVVGHPAVVGERRAAGTQHLDRLVRVHVHHERRELAGAKGGADDGVRIVAHRQLEAQRHLPRVHVL